MRREAFSDALFELCDLWTAGIEEAEYARFLRELLAHTHGAILRECETLAARRLAVVCEPPPAPAAAPVSAELHASHRRMLVQRHSSQRLLQQQQHQPPPPPAAPSPRWPTAEAFVKPQLTPRAKPPPPPPPPPPPRKVELSAAEKCWWTRLLLATPPVAGSTYTVAGAASPWLSPRAVAAAGLEKHGGRSAVGADDAARPDSFIWLKSGQTSLDSRPPTAQPAAGAADATAWQPQQPGGPPKGVPLIASPPRNRPYAPPNSP